MPGPMWLADRKYGIWRLKCHKYGICGAGQPYGIDHHSALSENAVFSDFATLKLSLSVRLTQHVLSRLLSPFWANSAEFLWVDWDWMEHYFTIKKEASTSMNFAQGFSIEVYITGCLWLSSVYYCCFAHCLPVYGNSHGRWQAESHKKGAGGIFRDHRRVPSHRSSLRKTDYKLCFTRNFSWKQTTYTQKTLQLCLLPLELYIAPLSSHFPPPWCPNGSAVQVHPDLKFLVAT